MNDILLLLWFADVAKSVSTLCGMIGFIGLIGGIVLVLIYRYEKKEWGFRWIPITGLVLCLIGAIIPSKQWFYIAAGGTAAVKALDSEIGIKVQKLVNQKLDEALGEKK